MDNPYSDLVKKEVVQRQTMPTKNKKGWRAILDARELAYVEECAKGDKNSFSNRVVAKLVKFLDVISTPPTEKEKTE